MAVSFNESLWKFFVEMENSTGDSILQSLTGPFHIHAKSRFFHRCKLNKTELQKITPEAIAQHVT